MSKISGINCAVNNGGCTYACSGSGVNGICTCPNACWETSSSDSRRCIIKADKVDLRCHQDSMEAYIAKCATEGLEFARLPCRIDTVSIRLSPIAKLSNLSYLCANLSFLIIHHNGLYEIVLTG